MRIAGGVAEHVHNQRCRCCQNQAHIGRAQAGSFCYSVFRCFLISAKQMANNFAALFQVDFFGVFLCMVRNCFVKALGGCSVRSLAVCPVEHNRKCCCKNRRCLFLGNTGFACYGFNILVTQK